MKALLLFLSMLLVVIMALAGFLWFDGDRVRRQGKNPMQGDDIHVYFVGKIDTEGHRYYLTNIDPESIRQCLDKHSMD